MKAEERSQGFDSRIAVRRLAELLYREGGLQQNFMGGVEASEGLRAQQNYLASLPQEGLLIEKALAYEREIARHRIHLSGRADLIDSQVFPHEVVEIKAYRAKRGFHASAKAAHWAQARLYAGMYAQELPSTVESLTVSLLYVDVETGAFFKESEQASVALLKHFLDESLERYAKRVRNILAWEHERNRAAKKAGFPFQNLRAGQAEMMREVLGALRDQQALLVQAPTGIGKTLAVLYPALKAQAAGYVQQVFYATAMTSTRQVAEEALDRLRDQGFLLRSLTLSAKEKLCLAPELFCDMETCPYAVSYYDRLPEAMGELLGLERLSPESIRQAAKQHTLCPFELSLDLAMFCDVIVGDYNHLFDPRVRLKRLLQQENSSLALLVDEAHNLVARSREMYSAPLQRRSFQPVWLLWEHEQGIFKGRYPKLQQQLSLIDASLARVERAIAPPEKTGAAEADAPFLPDNNPLAEAVDPANWFLGANFFAMREAPKKLLQIIAAALFSLKTALDENPRFERRRALLELFFELLHFYRMSEGEADEGRVLAGRSTAQGFALYQLCLDPANALRACYMDQHPVVFFSATLSPVSYYEALFAGQTHGSLLSSLLLPSPFPAEHRLVLVHDKISLRYQDRQGSLDDVLDLLLEVCAQKLGNYLIYCPSYQYLAQIRKALQLRERPVNTDFILQRPGMDERQKKLFVRRFDAYGERSLYAFAVLGSLFNEGIDLQGERLSGVIILGTAIPPPSPERELMSQYYAERFGSGFHYAYVFPGFHRIQQAAGRLIRSHEDRGFVLLIDQRWSEPSYRNLLPRDWHAVIESDPLAVIDRVAAFWRSFNA